MITLSQYFNAKKALLTDSSICSENRKLFKDFFDFQEYKLKRRNNLSDLDDRCAKTLYAYVLRFRNIDRWFDKKPLRKITKSDIKRVYDGLEDGVILTSFGKPFRDRRSYYDKIFRSKLFEMIGKKQLAQEVMQFHKPESDSQPHFLSEQQFRKLVQVIIQPSQRCLAWLAFDIGENINSLLELKKSDFSRQIDVNTRSPEYRVNLPKQILKRSRTSRSEVTNYPDTVEFLDILLKGLKSDDLVFPFHYPSALKFLSRAVKITGVTCAHCGKSITWKDFRSGMACDLLSKGWTTDEVNARLGHKPSSREIDKYVNFLAIDRSRPKRKVEEHTLKQVHNELAEAKDREKLLNKRLQTLTQQQDQFADVLKSLMPQLVLPTSTEQQKMLIRGLKDDGVDTTAFEKLVTAYLKSPEGKKHAQLVKQHC